MTSLLPRLLGLAYPACATDGAAGLPVPELLDFAKLGRPRPGNSALAAPPGMRVLPDIVTKLRHLPPRALYAALTHVALTQPRTVLHVEYPEQLQAHFVVRSALRNFPDLVAVQITPDSFPILYSRSIYGRSDFGANRQRLVAWLTALDAVLQHA